MSGCPEGLRCESSGYRSRKDFVATEAYPTDRRLLPQTDRLLPERVANADGILALEDRWKNPPNDGSRITRWGDCPEDHHDHNQSDCPNEPPAHSLLTQNGHE